MDPHRLTRVPPPTILVVDDHADLRDAITVLLHNEGFQTADASTGTEALECLRANPALAAIIVDLDMPVMNGWEFLAACQRNPAWRRIPTLVLTALSPYDPRWEDLQGRMVFTKPFNFDDLLQGLRRAMIRPVPPSEVFIPTTAAEPPDVLATEHQLISSEGCCPHCECKGCVRVSALIISSERHLHYHCPCCRHVWVEREERDQQRPFPYQPPMAK